jgi:hypothetical protein
MYALNISEAGAELSLVIMEPLLINCLQIKTLQNYSKSFMIIHSLSRGGVSLEIDRYFAASYNISCDNPLVSIPPVSHLLIALCSCSKDASTYYPPPRQQHLPRSTYCQWH